MKIKKIETTKYSGSCNGCDRGVIDKGDNTRLIYPEGSMYEIMFKGI